MELLEGYLVQLGLRVIEINMFNMSVVRVGTASKQS